MEKAMEIEKKFMELGLECRQYLNPDWFFTTFVVDGDTLYVSGHTPTIDGKLQYSGTVGENVDKETAKKAAVLCLENCLGTMKTAVGDLDRIESIVKVNGFVACPNNYTSQAEIINAISEPLYKVFKQKHARAAIGVSSLPRGAPVEVEMIAKIKA